MDAEPPPSPLAGKTIKVVVIGDGNVGKTCLLISFCTNSFPSDVAPTVFDSHVTEIQLDDQIATLGLFDTGGQETFDNIRHLSYDKTDVFLICYSCVNANSFLNVKSRWIPEVKKYAPFAPILIVATQKDLRDDPETTVTLQKHRQKPVTFERGAALAQQIGAGGFVECSALTQEGLKEVFENAARIAVKRENRKRKKKKKGCVIL